MIVDYEYITSAWNEVHRIIDHRCLNDIVGLENPTTEVLVVWIAKLLKQLRGLYSIKVFESSATWCEYVVQVAAAPSATTVPDVPVVPKCAACGEDVKRVVCLKCGEKLHHNLSFRYCGGCGTQGEFVGGLCAFCKEGR
jgi:hypothetical protein